MSRSEAVAAGMREADWGRVAPAVPAVHPVVTRLFTGAFTGARRVGDTHGRALLDLERWAFLDAERPPAGGGARTGTP
ncbi:hypothetical protein [Actinomadura sp. 3N407]|uniref:hypothetical protein n=1 Tax=Actinomadura sp. 3N407 TaxID=3457423 RepID=UPI003FCEE1C3